MSILKPSATSMPTTGAPAPVTLEHLVLPSYNSAMPDDDMPSTGLATAQPDGFDRLLRGAIDLHVHGRPDLSPGLPNRGNDLEVARLARAYGMSGWVLKSHLWATTDRARSLRESMAGTGFTVHGSITLNPPAGGLEPAVVELAAAHGARVVFLPTWGSAADLGRGGYIPTLLGRIAPSFGEYAARTPIALCEPDGSLSEPHAGGDRRVPDARSRAGDRARLARGEPGGRGVLCRGRAAAARHPPAALHDGPRRAAGARRPGRLS